MLFPKTILVALLATAQVSSSSRPDGLSLDEFNSILFSEASSEFMDDAQTVGIDESALRWNAATNYEWSRAEKMAAGTFWDGYFAEGEEIPKSHSKMPYVVCDPTSHQSGIVIRSIVETHFGFDITPVQNKYEKTCFIATAASEVADSAPEGLVVQPLMSELKVESGTKEAIEQGLEGAVKFDVMLCPGASKGVEEAEGLAREALEMMRDVRRDGRSLVSSVFLRDGMEDEHERRGEWHRILSDGIDADHQCQDLFEDVSISALPKGQHVVFGTSKIHSPSCLLSFVAGLTTNVNVCYVGVLPEIEAFNIEAQWIVQSNKEDERPWFDAGLTGEGQVVAVSDSGLDTDNCYFWDATGEVPKDGSIDLMRRKVVQYVPYADSTEPDEGHGTHVVGTILGRRAVSGTEESNGSVDGIAHHAKVAFYDIGITGQRYLDIPDSVPELMNPGIEAGAKIHSGSWGSSTNIYAARGSLFDDFVYDDEDFLIIMAAGNGGRSDGDNTVGSVGSPATAKNIITVGATQSFGEVDLNDDMMGKDYLAYFSSRGPTFDGRTKPEILAPGYYIQSASSQEAIIGECDFNETGTTRKAGTSMATPVVSGTAALIRQYFMEGWYPAGEKVPGHEMEPSGTLIKAILINGAQYILGIQNEDRVDPVVPYDNSQNFGRISMLDSLPLAGQNNIGIHVVDRKLIMDGQVDTYEIDIDTTSGSTDDFSVTLVWVDPPNVPNCVECVLNDLDLLVTKNGGAERMHPNGKDGPDTINNSERIRMSVTNGDKIMVHVKATDLETQSQSYALVITGPFEPFIPGPPSSVPPSPTSAPVSGATLMTTFEGGLRQNGAMFDVRVKDKRLQVTSLDVNTFTEGPVTFYAWTKDGTFAEFQDEEDQWQFLGEFEVEGQGRNVPSALPPFSDPVLIESGNVQAFYVSTEGYDLVYTDGELVGKFYKGNDDMDVHEGIGIRHKFNETFATRIWNGVIHYDTL